MTRPHENQVVLPLDTPSWRFEASGPGYEVSFAGTYVRSHAVDPAPCYAHDPALVRDELAHLQRVAPLPYPLAIVLLAHEVTSRTNGLYYHEPVYRNESSEPVGIIVLSGKRIPIHPAMTRYLVAHEYGHSVEERLVQLLGYTKDTQLLEDYARDVRPGATRAYGCGRWHQNTGELFANDFRVLVANREVEFWPHPGFAHPLGHQPAIEWWARASEQLRAAGAERSAA